MGTIENNLFNANPNLSKEWHPTKNGTRTPYDVTPNSSLKVWWKGSCGHEWEAQIKSRNNGRGCPFCSGRFVLTGFNDIATTNPEIIKEWDFEKNIDVTPETISANSHKKIWLKCGNGHSWETSPNKRIGLNRGCPYCSHNPRVLPGYNDLETVFPELAKEWNYDKNDLSPREVTSSSNKKVWWKCPKGHEWRTSVNHRADGSGCPICSKGAQSSFPEQAVFYYVKKAYPDAIHRYKDIFINRRMELDIYIPSLKIGIEYDGEVYHRGKTKLKQDNEKTKICRSSLIRLIRIKENPQSDEAEADVNISARDGLQTALLDLCKYLPKIERVDIERDSDIIRSDYLSSLGEKSLLMKNPELCKEWNYERNETTPDMFLPGSNIVVWWKCQLGHEWMSAIYERNKGEGCPYCSNNKVLSGFNDLFSVRPDLMNEWHPTKNSDLDPKQILPGSGIKAWWKCKYGHEWYSEISSRNKGAGCPQCGIRNRNNMRNLNRIKSSGSLYDNNINLAKEWHPIRNGMLTPKDVTAGSQKKVWWLCPECGYEWEAVIGSRNQGRGCPRCYKTKRNTDI